MFFVGWVCNLVLIPRLKVRVCCSRQGLVPHGLLAEFTEVFDQVSELLLVE